MLKLTAISISSLFASLILLITTLSGCKAGNIQPKEGEIQEITYAIPITIAAIPSYVAADQGYWEEAGLKVNLQYFNSGREALEALLAGQAELMSVSETPPMHAVIQGQKIYWIATVVEHHEAKLTVRTDVISEPIDLIGKRIGTVAGTNSDYYMYIWLKHYGIDASEVSIVSLTPPAMVQAFVQGEIDAMFAWEPYNFNAYSKVPDKSESWPTELYEGRHSMIMNQDFVKKHPEVVEKIIKGLYRAEQFIQENPEKAKEIVSRITGIDRGVLDSLWAEYTVRVELDDRLLVILNSEATWALAIKDIEQPIPNFRNYIYIDAMNIVLPDRVGENLHVEDH